MDYPEESPRVLSTCTGYGGLELGIAAALGRPLRVVAYVEREAYACANLAAKVEAGALPCAPLWTDLRTFDARPLLGCVDILTGGYPCQPFSVAGKRLGADDPRHLWPEYARLIGECRPAWCFFENVRGHVSKGLRDVRCDLADLGYGVECGLFSAEEVGANHRRERVYILAADAHRELVRLESGRRSGEDRDGRTVPVLDGETQSLADADGVRESQPGGRVGAERGWPGDGRRPSPGAMAHPDGSRLEGYRGIYGRAEDARTGGPPVRGWWDVEPDMGRVAHGSPNRVDRLRLLGNGVVPKCAEHAFQTLYGRFLGGAR